MTEYLRKHSKLLLTFLAFTLVFSLLHVGKVEVKAAENVLPEIPTFDIPTLEQDTALPNVIVIGTGGTLAGKARDNDPTNFQSYAAGTFLIADLVDQLPRKDKIADVETYQFGNKGSGGYTMKDLYDLSLAVDQALKTYDSAVVTTGTDTMEEIAYFLDLTVQSDKPVVVTGAMRPWDVIGTDGPANLYQAIKVAASNKTKYYGTVIMLNDVIHAAREVTKSNSTRMDTFNTPMLGALGYVDDSAVRMYRLNARALKAGKSDWATPFDLTKISKESLPLVGVVYNYQEASGGQIRGLVADGVKGIVTAGTGAGGISSGLSSARTQAIRDGVIFVSTTRTGSGSVYGSSNGNIAGDNLNAQHARVLLMLSLAFSDDYNQIKTWFETVGTQDISVTVASDPEVPIPTPSPTPKPTPTPGDDGGTGEETTPTPTPTITPDPNGEGGGTTPNITLNDINNHWAKETIERAVAAGLIKGYTDGSFKPNASITRSEFAVVLMRAMKPEGSADATSFSDSNAIAAWAEEAINQAVKAGIITGYEDGYFRPAKEITRMELAVMVARALKLDVTATSTGFADDANIPQWAKGAVAAVKEQGVIQGRDNNLFDPLATATRAEAVTMIINMLKLME